MTILADCHRAAAVLRREMDAWLAQTVRMDPPGQQGGGEDEANYALAFFPHYRVTGNADCVGLFESLLEELRAWVRRDCVHGYEAEAEAHHGPEPFILFLPRFHGLRPGRATAVLLDGAARHIGGWEKLDGVPA